MSLICFALKPYPGQEIELTNAVVTDPVGVVVPEQIV
jgi:hypothetical protein